MNYLLCVYTQVQILTGAIKFMHTRFSLWYLWEEENDDDIHVQNKWSFTKILMWQVNKQLYSCDK